MRKHRYTQQQVDQITIAGRVIPTRSVFSVASNDVDFTTRIGCGVQIWQYRLWVNMLNRCYSSKHQMTYPSYKGVIVCDEWLSFGDFFEWVNKEVVFRNQKHLRPDVRNALLRLRVNKSGLYREE